MKKIINLIAILSVASYVSACSKASSNKKNAKPKSVKNKFLDYRRPKDNAFIQNGGYSKKSKANPFETKKAENQTAPKQPDNVVYDKKSEDKSNNIPASPLSYKMEKKNNKKGVLKSIASAIASIFKPKTGAMTQVASKSDIYRPLVNKMVIAGTYSPDHSNLIEQGSYDYEYADTSYVSEDIIIDPIGQIDSTPIINKPLKASKPITKKKKNKAYISTNFVAPTPAPVESIKNHDVQTNDNEQNLKHQISTKITSILNISKMLYGINAEESAPEIDVDIPEIKDQDLKQKKGSIAPELKDIPPVPNESSFKQS